MFELEYRVVEIEREAAFVEPFIVPTPKAYVVDLAHYKSPEEKAAVVRHLLGQAEGLSNILRILGISYPEAFEREYSLNLTTREALYRLSLSNSEARKALEALNL